MVFGVLEFIQASQYDSRQVEKGDESEELPICVEPKIEQDPSAYPRLWRRNLLDHDLCDLFIATL
jgi:hypothetical protein